MRNRLEQKIILSADVAQLCRRYRDARKTIVFANGCFDLLHIGHVSHLTEAARLGDVLIVAVNSDASVRRLKGPGRPIIPENDRSRMLAALSCVDHVVVFESDTPLELLRVARPDVLAKGGTYLLEDVVGRSFVESYGGVVVITDEVSDISTTRLIEHVKIGQPGSL